MKKLCLIFFLAALLVAPSVFAGYGYNPFTGNLDNSGGSSTETDPIAGAVTGIVEADGAGNISAATAGTDYLSPAAFKLDQNVETLSGNKTLTTSDLPVQKLDPDGSDRDVRLPAEGDSTDLPFFIYNMANGAGEDLVIKDDTPATLATILPGNLAICHCDGTTWTVRVAFPPDDLQVDGVAGSVVISGTASLEDSATEPTGSGDQTITVAQCRRGVLTDKNLTGNADFVLDDEDAYLSLQILIVVGTHTISVVPPTGEKIWMDGVALDANDEIDLSTDEGDKFSLKRRYSTDSTGYVWDLETVRGTASDGGAGD